MGISLIFLKKWVYQNGNIKYTHFCKWVYFLNIPKKWKCTPKKTYGSHAVISWVRLLQTTKMWKLNNFNISFKMKLISYNKISVQLNPLKTSTFRQNYLLYLRIILQKTPWWRLGVRGGDAGDREGESDGEGDTLLILFFKDYCS